MSHERVLFSVVHEDHVAASYASKMPWRAVISLDREYFRTHAGDRVTIDNLRQPRWLVWRKAK
jgi:hypothetical protein